MSLISRIYKSDKRWIVRKLTQAILASLIMFIIFVLWIEQSRYFEQKFQTANYQTAKALSSLVAQRFLYMNGFEDASATLDYIVQSNRVIDASLYDPKGQVIASSSNYLSVADSTGLNPYGSVAIIPTVTELFDEHNEIIGYLRMSFDKNEFNQPQQEILEKQSSNGRLMLFLAALVGMLFSRAFYRQVSVKSNPDQ